MRGHRAARATVIGFATIGMFGLSAQVAAPAGAQTTVATIGVGSLPYDVAITPDGSAAYVVNLSSNNVSVIDTASNTVTTTISGVGGEPTGIAITPDGSKAYAANFSAGTVSVIDTASNTVVGGIGGFSAPGGGVAVTPDGSQVYVTNAGGNSVSVIDTATDTVTAKVGVGSVPYGVAITPDGKYAWVANEYSNNVSIVSTTSHTVTATVPAGNGPYGVAFSPDGKTAYVTDVGGNSVTAIDTATDAQVGSVGVGTYPHGVAVTPDGNDVLVTTAGSASVSVIDASSLAVTATVGVGDTPFGIAITPDGAAAYVANRGYNTVSVISLAEPPAITSAANASLTVGEPGSFTVATTGKPAPSLTTSGSLPTGVTFTDNHDGTATIAGTPDAGTVGSYPVTITASNTVGSTHQDFTLTVAKAQPTLGLTASTDAADAGTAVRFTATATVPSAETLTPSGDVDFYVNGAATPSASVPLTDGSAVWTTSALPAGTDAVVAKYVGDANFTPAQSQPASVTVRKVPTTLTATPALIKIAGLRVYLFDLTATLSSPSGPVSGATISFTAGSTRLCTAVTDSAGTASCNALTSALPIVLSLGYQAKFAGDATYLPSSASAGLIG